jgi:hypothetical protein
MFKDLEDPARSDKSRQVADYFASSEIHKSHSRSINRDDAVAAGLVVENLEADQDLQDAVLSVHHAFMITLQATTAVKIIENNLGSKVVGHQQIAHMGLPVVFSAKTTIGSARLCEVRVWARWWANGASVDGAESTQRVQRTDGL